MEFTEEEKKVFSKMSKNSAEKRGLNKMSPQERSEYMKKVRAKQKLSK